MKVFASALLFTLLSMSSPQAESSAITIKKPSPCYEIESYSISDRVLNVHLKRKSPDALCPQVITEERLSIDSEKVEKVKLIRVYIGDRLWDEFSQ